MTQFIDLSPLFLRLYQIIHIGTYFARSFTWLVYAWQKIRNNNTTLYKGCNPLLVVVTLSLITSVNIKATL